MDYNFNFLPHFIPNVALPFDLKITPYNSGHQSRLKEDCDALFCSETMVRPNIIKIDSLDQE